MQDRLRHHHVSSPQGDSTLEPRPPPARTMDPTDLWGTLITKAAAVELLPSYALPVFALVFGEPGSMFWWDRRYVFPSLGIVKIAGWAKQERRRHFYVTHLHRWNLGPTDMIYGARRTRQALLMSTRGYVCWVICRMCMQGRRRGLQYSNGKI